MKTSAWKLLGLIASTHLAVVAQAAPDPTSGHPDSSTWPALFKADLSDAIFPAGIWTVDDGVFTASEDEALWSEAEHDGFVLDLEFKNAAGSNSGVIVYASDIKDWIPNSVEIQIADDHAEQWARAPKSWQCGAAFGHQPPTRSVVKKASEWNRMTIWCQGPMITVVINGEKVNTIDTRRFTSAKTNPDGTEIPAWLNKPLASLPTRGHIGFQGKHAGAPIYFRNIRIQELR